ncbi:MAG: acetate kinase, partial [Vulcanimicrobiaceae bacterium]
MISAGMPLPAGGFKTGEALERMLRIVPGGGALSAVGHRVVFGGPQSGAAVLAGDRVLAELEAFVPMEPLHLRGQLDLVAAIETLRPGLPQVLCFDTAFHRDMPHVATLVALPPEEAPGIRRYGFHGLSYEYIVWKLNGAPGRTVIAHLGSGASLCAVRDGKPVDTTMGFSPLSGLVMATRPGDLDPGIMLALMRDGHSVADLTDLLYRRSGLLGLSGLSADLRELASALPQNARARDAVALFQYELVKQMGAMIAALGGLDTLVFTGGIGEHQPAIRSA